MQLYVLISEEQEIKKTLWSIHNLKSFGHYDGMLADFFKNN